MSRELSLTVKLLMDRPNLHDIQHESFADSSLKYSFRNVDYQNLIDSIKETRFYNQLLCSLITFYIRVRWP